MCLYCVHTHFVMLEFYFAYTLNGKSAAMMQKALRTESQQPLVPSHSNIVPNFSTSTQHETQEIAGISGRELLLSSRLHSDLIRRPKELSVPC